MEPITTTSDPTITDDPALQRTVMRTIARRDFCMVATVSPAGRPHVAGVVYSAVGSSLWIHTVTTSRKARNIIANPHVAVSIPFRRLPAGPPFTIHFQARAQLVAMDDPDVIRAAFDESGLPVDALFEGMQDPGVKAKLIANTEASVERGNFGSPTFFVDDELFFGKDKLRDAEEEIMARRGA